MKNFTTLFRAIGSLLIAGIFIIGCRNEASLPDISEIELGNNYIRFEEELFAIDTNNIQPGLDSLIVKYPSFTELYFTRILPLGKPGDTALYGEVRGFLTEESIIALKDTVDIVFNDFKEIEEDFDKAFKYMKYYFPHTVAPNVYTLISEFGYQRFLFADNDRDGLGIGLDLFLGSQYPYKAIAPQNPAFSNYLTRSFNKDHIVRKTMEILVEDLIGEAPGARLLDQMIHNGKKLYLLQKILPDIPDTVLYVYPEDKMEWVRDNELEMWSFFFKESLFYETNMVKINKYINPSPNSPGMPDMAPGRTANYLGHRIVEAYMKRKPNLTLQELIEEKDYQKIMDESKYKPKARES